MLIPQKPWWKIEISLGHKGFQVYIDKRSGIRANNHYSMDTEMMADIRDLIALANEYHDEMDEYNKQQKLIDEHQSEG